MKNWCGINLHGGKLQHLDLAESERADVLRGLRTYVASSPQNARTFAALYAKLPGARQVLEPGLVKALSEGRAPGAGER